MVILVTLYVIRNVSESELRVISDMCNVANRERKQTKKAVISFVLQLCTFTSGVARGQGGSCPRPPPGGGAKILPKEILEIYILRNFLKSERIIQ